MSVTGGTLPNTPAYILANWPRGLQQLEHCAFVRPYNASALLDLCHWAGMSGPHRLRQHGIAYRAVWCLANEAASDRHSAAYHQSGHTAHVIMAAGLLAAADGLSPADTDLLILAALAHDVDHQGKYRCRGVFQTELWSAHKARGALYRTGSDARVAVRLTDLLVATSFVDHPLRDAVLAADPLAAYLVDADLFASLFYKAMRVRRLTALIKFEERDNSQIDAMLHGFVQTAIQRGFYTDAAAGLHAGLTPGHSILHDPALAAPEER